MGRPRLLPALAGLRVRFLREQLLPAGGAGARQLGPAVGPDLQHRGGRGDPHAARPDPGLLAITVEDVLAA